MATEHPREHGGVLTERTADALMAAFMFAVGVVIVVSNYQLGAGWAKDGPESGYFPLRIGVLICIAAVIVFIQALRDKQLATKSFLTRSKLKPVMLVLVPTIAYVAGIQFVGIYVASAVFIAAFMRIMDKYSWGKTLAISIGLNVLLFWMFEVQFMVPLPKGPLEAYFGY